MLFINPSSIVPGNFSIKLELGNGHGSTNTCIRRFTNTIGSNTLTGYVTYADSNLSGGSFTVVQAGWYIMAYSDYYSGSDAVMGISVNSNQLTTSILSITSANRLAITDNPAANRPGFCCSLKYLSVGDVIRAHTSGANDGNNVKVWFYMAKVA